MANCSAANSVPLSSVSGLHGWPKHQPLKASVDYAQWLLLGMHKLYLVGSASSMHPVMISVDGHIDKDLGSPKRLAS